MANKKPTSNLLRRREVAITEVEGLISRCELWLTNIKTACDFAKKSKIKSVETDGCMQLEFAADRLRKFHGHFNNSVSSAVADLKLKD